MKTASVVRCKNIGFAQKKVSEVASFLCIHMFMHKRKSISMDIPK